MSDNDTSDDAFKKWYDKEAVPKIELLSTYSTAKFARESWAEAVRRCEAQKEEWIRKGFEAGMLAALGKDLSLDNISEAYTRVFKNLHP